MEIETKGRRDRHFFSIEKWCGETFSESGILWSSDGLIGSSRAIFDIGRSPAGMELMPVATARSIDFRLSGSRR